MTETEASILLKLLVKKFEVLINRKISIRYSKSGSAMEWGQGKEICYLMIQGEHIMCNFASIADFDGEIKASFDTVICRRRGINITDSMWTMLDQLRIKEVLTAAKDIWESV